jgi:hypothetical protein
MRNQFALAAVAAIVLSAPSPAQQPGIRHVLNIRVKRDRVGDFQAAITDLHQGLKSIKWERPTLLFSSMSGPNQYKLVRT